MLNDELPLIASLLRGQRSGALGTITETGSPFVSFVAYAPEPDFGGFLLHLSSLAAHARHLKADERASLLIALPDDRREDVQTLARITITGRAAIIPRDDAGYDAAGERYLTHLPAAAQLFGFGDFVLYRLVPDGARYVGGFARALTLSAEQLRRSSQNH
jgi:putative heme iron utilization protein